MVLSGKLEKIMFNKRDWAIGALNGVRKKSRESYRGPRKA